jgi:hypothetical protein
VEIEVKKGIIIQESKIKSKKVARGVNFGVSQGGEEEKYVFRPRYKTLPLY